jgi:hypothetical protein
MGIQSFILLMMTLAVRPGDRPAQPGAFEDGRVIVRMVGRDKTLTISSSARGRTYSVTDASGKMLLARGSLDELREKYPQLWQQVQTGQASARSGSSPTEDASISLDAGF